MQVRTRYERQRAKRRKLRDQVSWDTDTYILWVESCQVVSGIIPCGEGTHELNNHDIFEFQLLHVQCRCLPPENTVEQSNT